MHYVPTEPELQHLGGNQIGGNQQTFYPDLWEWMIVTLRIQTVLDVGCGEGHALNDFQRLGCNAVGIDGAPRNTEIAGNWRTICHDLARGPLLYPYWLMRDALPVDLVWCCEVVGQIEERYVQHVIDTIAQGRYLALTHQVPGQQGYHMVNCQPREYWIERIERAGMRYLPETTEHSKQYGHHFWADTGMIFGRRNR